VNAPTLLIAGGDDLEVLALNRNRARQAALRKISLSSCPAPRTLFEEPGRLGAVLSPPVYMSPGPFSSTAVLDGMSGILGCTRAYRPMALSPPAVSRNGRSDGRQLAKSDTVI
jgi:hypothetical protein